MLSNKNIPYTSHFVYPKKKRKTYKGVGFIGIFLALWTTLIDVSGLFEYFLMKFESIENEQKRYQYNLVSSLENANIEKQRHLSIIKSFQCASFTLSILSTDIFIHQPFVLFSIYYSFCVLNDPIDVLFIFIQCADICCLIMRCNSRCTLYPLSAISTISRCFIIPPHFNRKIE